MSKIKLYYETLTQPSRALKLFLLVNKVPFEGVAVNLAKGEQRSPGFISPFHKVPVLEHNGFVLTESIAIFRYLCREVDVPDHWYPRDSKRQAKVDEYLEWQHLNTRFYCGGYFQQMILESLLKGKAVDEKMVKFYRKGMETVFDQLCNIWLKDSKYLCGDQISVADLLAVSELEQPRMAGYDVCKDWPILKAYMDRVRGDLHPHYSEVMKRFDKFIAKFGDQVNVSAKL